MMKMSILNNAIYFSFELIRISFIYLYLHLYLNLCVIELNFKMNDDHICLAAYVHSLFVEIKYF